MIRDHRELPVTGATPDTLARYETALAAFNCYHGDPVARVDEALTAAPQFVMAHALKAALYLSGTEQPAAEAAADFIAHARTLPANDRERALLDALDQIAHGEFTLAAERFDSLLADHPRDLLALQIAHLYDFNRGDTTRLRERPAAVLKRFSRDLPGHHAVLGMHAFGLEESGDYNAALDQGHAALAANRKDAWAHHAVAHVFEMRGEIDAGIAWMRDREPDWSPDNLMAVHNWWHLTLYHLDRGDTSDALRLYDTRVRPGDSKVVLELIDATAMLWRMHLRGIDVGDRWQPLADAWSAHEADDFYAFNTWHAALTQIAAGREDAAHRLVARMEYLVRAGAGSNGTGGPRDTLRMAMNVTLPLLRGVTAFVRGEYSQAAETLARARPGARQFGGSHAQRDLITLTLMEALRRAGSFAGLRALAAERLAAKPHDRVGLVHARAAYAAQPQVA
ncbi:MAG: tetratricopeptide repeat protein [Betaproteobacteria bacterium]|nr:tetratricopeptide repeat protein [Betaproteobacteria bacterium]